MKECDRIASLFIELHDRQVDRATEEDMRDHFLMCTDCREDFKWYSITVNALGTFDEVSPPKDFMLQLGKRIYGPPPTPWYSSYSDFISNLFSSSPYLPLPVGVATLAVVLVVGVALYNHAPTELLQAGVPLQAYQPVVGPPVQGGTPAAGDVHSTRSPQWPSPTPLAATAENNLPRQIARIPEPAVPKSKSLGNLMGVPSGRFLTVAEKIGGDNLTVESPSVDSAVESVKKILPDIRGRLVEEVGRGKIEERVLGVIIPSGSYGHLATELINHGAVAVGAGSDSSTPAPSRADNNNVILYIRFVRSQ